MYLEKQQKNRKKDETSQKARDDSTYWNFICFYSIFGICIVFEEFNYIRYTAIKIFGNDCSVFNIDFVL